MTEDIALNLDPISLANGSWVETEGTTDITNTKYYKFKVKNSSGDEIDTKIEKTGDVEYDEESKALKFNENEIENPEGEGGLIRLLDSELNVEDGLTFEIYMNLKRLQYKKDTTSGLGLFCKGYRDLDVGDFMRFGLFDYAGNKGIICKFRHGSVVSDYYGINGLFFHDGGVGIRGFKFESDKDVYFSVVYKVYDTRCNG